MFQRNINMFQRNIFHLNMFVNALFTSDVIFKHVSSFIPGCVIYAVFRHLHKSCTKTKQHFHSLFSLVSIFKPFGGEGLSSVWRADSICAIIGTRKIVCKLWFCVALAAAAVKFRGDVLPNIQLSIATHRQ